MATNSLLTPTQVTRAALVILHQKLNFIGSINRQYDDEYATKGAKIGSQLKIRLPNKYTTRTGANFSANNTEEQNTTLTMATQKGIDTQFTSAELTLSIDDFSDRILEPAMAQLASSIESDALSMVNDVYQTVDNTTNQSMTLLVTLQARQKLVDALAPAGTKTALLTTQDNLELVNVLKGLFQDSKAIAEQYREGIMGRTGGFDFYENTLLTNLTSGTLSATSNMVVTSTITPTTSTNSIGVNCTTTVGTMKVGDVFTIATLNRVHPESKADTGVLQQFVVTTNTVANSTTSISFSPAIVMSGAYQNVINTAISTQAIVKIGNTSRSLRQSMYFHKDAFAFVSADLIKPKGVHECARQVYDGISMRMITFYDGSTDQFGTRLDVLYGYKTIRPELAAKTFS
jgi:hypothetical protein